MFKWIFLLLLSVLQLQVALANQKIVNGVEVQPQDPIARSTVLITGKYQRFSYTCSGTLIAPDLVLTAAHCLGPYSSAALTVFFGVNKNQSGTTFKVISKKLPADYNVEAPQDRNDIAILKIERIAPSGYTVAPLFSGDELIRSGDDVILAGYGINVPTMPSRGDGGIGVLRFAEQKIIEPLFGMTEVIINIKGKGTCSGDSGGPAYIKRNGQLILFGAASRMTAKNIVPGSKPVRYECTEEIVYTRVDKRIEWILDTMKDLQ